jgi:hypothetical protein
MKIYACTKDKKYFKNYSGSILPKILLLVKIKYIYHFVPTFSILLFKRFAFYYLRGHNKYDNKSIIDENFYLK